MKQDTVDANKRYIIHTTPQETQYNRNMINNDITFADREKALKITSAQAYEFVKSGVWSLKTFEIWLDHVVCNAEYKAQYYGNL